MLRQRPDIRAEQWRGYYLPRLWGKRTMPVNLENLLRQAATCIDPKKDKGAYAYMIGEEVADHIAQVRSGEIPLDAFAEHYGLIKQAYP